MVDTTKLRKYISKRDMTVSDLALAMGIDKATLYRRIAQPKSFTIGEALRITEILDLSHVEAAAIFFAEEVA